MKKCCNVFSTHIKGGNERNDSSLGDCCPVCRKSVMAVCCEGCSLWMRVSAVQLVL